MVCHAGGKLSSVRCPDISLEGVHKCCRGSSWAALAVGWLPQYKGGAQGAPRAFDSGLQARVSSKLLCLKP